MKQHEEYAESIIAKIERTIFWNCDRGEWTTEELIPLAIYVIQKQIEALDRITLKDIQQTIQTNLVMAQIIDNIQELEKAIQYLKSKQ